jgi:predicted nucleic acid-binding protein
VSLVVSDNSPLNILIRVECAEVLELLFGEVVIPGAVAREMGHPAAPMKIQAFINSPPTWLRIEEPTALLSLPSLDPGERAAISLAKELGAPLLIDERIGRRVAKAQGLEIIGAVGVLERAADLGFIADLAEIHARILELDFHISEAILAKSLSSHLKRRSEDEEAGRAP